MPEPTVRITNLPTRSNVDPASLVAVVDLSTNETVRMSLFRVAESLGLVDEGGLEKITTKLRDEISDDRRWAGIVRLENVAGVNSITANVPQAATDLGIRLGNGSFVLLRPVNDTSSDEPTLQVNGGFIRVIRDADQKKLKSERLRAGVTYLLRLESDGAYRLMAALPTIQQLESSHGSTMRSVDANNTAERALDPMDAVASAVQRDGKIPLRPNALVVQWHCWDDPTAFMVGSDIWVQHEPPTLPRAPGASDFTVKPTHLSGQIALRMDRKVLFEHAELKRIEYRVNNGAVIPVTPVPTEDRWQVISGLSGSTSHGVEVRLVNFLGAGPWSPVVRAQPDTSSYFRDDFSRGNEALPDSDDYDDMPISILTGQLEVNNNIVRPTKTNHQQQVRLRRPFGEDHWAEATYIDGASNDKKSARVCVRMSGPTTYYALHASRNRWAVLRFKNTEDAFYENGVLMAEGVRNSQGTREVFRLEVEGGSLRAYESGALLARVTDPVPLVGGAPGLSLESSGADGLNDSRIDNFRAGRV